LELLAEQAMLRVSPAPPMFRELATCEANLMWHRG
jgi:hypothetical protein